LQINFQSGQDELLVKPFGNFAASIGLCIRLPAHHKPRWLCGHRLYILGSPDSMGIIWIRLLVKETAWSGALISKNILCFHQLNFTVPAAKQTPRNFSSFIKTSSERQTSKPCSCAGLTQRWPYWLQPMSYSTSVQHTCKLSEVLRFASSITKTPHLRPYFTESTSIIGAILRQAEREKQGEVKVDCRWSWFWNTHMASAEGLQRPCRYRGVGAPCRLAHPRSDDDAPFTPKSALRAT
jgi:hypothetical protein